MYNNSEMTDCFAERLEVTRVPAAASDWWPV